MKRSFGGSGGRGGMNPNDMMRQLQRLQAEMERVQAETEKEELKVTAGGGAIEIVITGGLEIKSIKLDPELLNPDDVEMVQDLLLSAVNDAIKKAQALMAERMSAFTGGLGIPGLM